MQTQVGNKVDTIYSTERAFAAKLKDDRIVTWGHQTWGGNSSDVQDIIWNGE